MKNPISVCFGLSLKHFRQKGGFHSSDVAEAIGIQPSFYRLVESGTNNLHISKCIRLVQAFEGFLDYKSVFCYLGTIATTEAEGRIHIKQNGNYLDGLKDSLNTICTYDKKMLILFKKVETFSKIKLYENDMDIFFESPPFQETLERSINFLENYKDFGVNSEVTESENLSNFFRDVPSIYVDYLTKMKQELLVLPVRMFFSDIGKWETNSIEYLTDLFAVIDNPYGIIHYENLVNYHYKYLWGNKFRKAKFIFTNTTKSAVDLKNEFIKNLKKSYKYNGILIPQDFDSKMDKVIFKTKYDDKTDKILGGYNSWWAFALVNKYDDSISNVGFTANTETHPSIDEYVIYKDGYCLTHSQNFNKIKQFRSLWGEE